MTIQATATVGSIATDHPQTVRVFQKVGLDFCCGGKLQLDEACARKGLSIDDVLKALEDASAATSPDTTDWAKRPLHELITHLLDKHHVFTRDELARVDPLVTKVARVHGEHYPQLIELKNVFGQLRDDLLPHLLKEEDILFPYVVEMERRLSNNEGFEAPFFGTVENPVRMMGFEHDAAGEMLARMRALTENYELPWDACGSFRAMYQGLEGLEADLHQHIHLENNLLFPRAIEMETKAGAHV